MGHCVVAVALSGSSASVFPYGYWVATLGFGAGAEFLVVRRLINKG